MFATKWRLIYILYLCTLNYKGKKIKIDKQQGKKKEEDNLTRRKFKPRDANIKIQYNTYKFHSFCFFDTSIPSFPLLEIYIL